MADGFIDRARGWWGSYVFPGSPSHIFASKLKALKMDSKQWNSNEFGNIFKQQKLLISLHELKTTSERRVLSKVEVYERNRLISELEKNTLLKEICCRQKSRVLIREYVVKGGG
jgi:hypothetical protein